MIMTIVHHLTLTMMTMMIGALLGRVVTPRIQQRANRTRLHRQIGHEQVHGVAVANQQAMAARQIKRTSPRVVAREVNLQHSQNLAAVLVASVKVKMFGGTMDGGEARYGQQQRQLSILHLLTLHRTNQSQQESQQESQKQVNQSLNSQQPDQLIT